MRGGRSSAPDLIEVLGERPRPTGVGPIDQCCTRAVPRHRSRRVRPRNGSRRRIRPAALDGRSGHGQALIASAGGGAQHHREVRVEDHGHAHRCRLPARFRCLQDVRADALLHQAETGDAHLHRAGDRGRHPQDGRLQVANRHHRPDRSDRHRRQLRMDGGRRHAGRRRVDRPGRKRDRLLPASQLGQWRRVVDDRGHRRDREDHRQRYDLGAVPGAGQGRQRLSVGARCPPALPPQRRSTPSRRPSRCSRAAAPPGRTWPR